MTTSNILMAASVVTAGIIYNKCTTGRKIPKNEISRHLEKKHPFPVYDEKEGEYWTTKKDGCIKIKLAKSGPASAPPVTIPEVLKKAANKNGSKMALKWEVGDDFKGYTYQEYYDLSQQFARALISCGFKQFDTINILGFNSKEWMLAHLGSICAGGKSAGIYPQNSIPQCQYITEHSEARFVIIGSNKQLDKFLEIRKKLGKKLEYIITYNTVLKDDINEEKDVAQVITFDDFMKKGEPTDKLEEELDLVNEKIKPGHCCSLIYTSGTTGNPKACMISHDNCMFQAVCSTPALDNWCDEPERMISYLPLSHIAAQFLDVYAPIYSTANYDNEVTMHFARPDFAKTILATLNKVEPTFFFAVPRVYEKFCAKIKAKGANNSPLKKKIVGWAKAKGAQNFINMQEGHSRIEPPLFDFVNKKLFTKVRAALGFGKCARWYSAAAPISMETKMFFGSLGMPIVEAYGLSETTGIISMNCHSYYKINSVGFSVPGCEIKLDHVEGRDKPGMGEICARSRTIMMGYLKNPEKTKAAIDEEGFFHSGDVGSWDEKNKNFLKITGRIKFLLITAGGENVAPLIIEENLKKYGPAISNCQIVGDKQKYLVALITLKTVPTEDGEGFTQDLDGPAAEIDASVKTVEDALKSDKVKAQIQKAIDATNKVAVSRAATVKKFIILPTDFSVKNKFLTPTMKLKKMVVLDHYKPQIKEAYGEAFKDY